MDVKFCHLHVPVEGLDFFVSMYIHISGSPLGDSEQWYYSQTGRSFGPVPLEALQALWAGGQALHVDDLV